MTAMRFGITQKLFLVFLATNAALVTVMVILFQWSVDRGFLNYVHETEVEGLDALGGALADAYAEHGSWEFLERNPRAWRRLLMTSHPMARRWRPPSGGREHPPDRPMPPPFLAFAGRISVFDADKNLLMGNPRGEANGGLRPILLNDETVGWVGIAPLRALTDEVDLRFVTEQSRALYVIAGLCIAIAALLSVLLAPQLLKPVKELAISTRSLAAGELDTRIEPTSSDELGRLASDFNSLAYTLEQNEQARRQWVADISHELRTPITILRAELEAVEDGVREPNEETLESLRAEVMRLDKLIVDLYELALSDVGALSYRKTDVDLQDVLGDAIQMFSERGGKDRIAIEYEQSEHLVTVFADPERLRQLFRNLLENSLRYTDSGGRMLISSDVLEGKARLIFEDSAPGVAEDQLPRLFDRLYRVEASRSRNTGGAGLGLAICKNIVEAHGGAIGASASPLGGLRIEIELPIVAEQSPTRES